jgi:hypothetical protein
MICRFITIISLQTDQIKYRHHQRVQIIVAIVTSSHHLRQQSTHVLLFGWAIVVAVLFICGRIVSETRTFLPRHVNRGLHVALCERMCAAPAVAARD